MPYDFDDAPTIPRLSAPLALLPAPDLDPDEWGEAETRDLSPLRERERGRGVILAPPGRVA